MMIGLEEIPPREALVGFLPALFLLGSFSEKAVLHPLSLDVGQIARMVFAGRESHVSRCLRPIPTGFAGPGETCGRAPPIPFPKDSAC